MPYNQYSEYAYTGDAESIKNRIPNNAYDATDSEAVAFPNKFDVFVNKENATQGGFAVVESHHLNSLEGTTLYLDHRPDENSSFTVSDGGFVNTGSLNLSTAAIDFSTVPTPGDSTFTISYTARGDKIWDSHINVMQNAIMKMQTSLGLLNTSGNAGTGIVTLPMVTQYEPSSQTDLTNIKNTVLPNIVSVGNLEGDFKIGSTSNSALDSYGEPGYNVVLGNRAGGSAARDDIYIDAELLSVNDQATGVSYLNYSTATGDIVGFTGVTNFRSQVTIGGPNPVSGIYSGQIPAGMETFYNDAMLRVNGSIYFGNGMSGNGAIIFNTVTGIALDVIGTVQADALIVDTTSSFAGAATFRRKVHALSPGYFRTNSDIVLDDKATNIPSKIDGLDPSYTNSEQKGSHKLDDVVSSPVYDRSFNTAHYNPYPYSKKMHPLHGFEMYPMLGGWTFTGSVNFDISTVHSHKSVALLSGNMRALEYVHTGQVYGSYAPGLFSPGDTYLEINNGGGDAFQYPIYWHEALTGLVVGQNTLTGVNLYLAGDDNILQTPGIAGQTYKIMQPGNAPMDFLSGDFTSSSSPVAKFGLPSSSYYGNSLNKSIYLKTGPTNQGPSAGASPEPLHKELKNNDEVTCSITRSLQRNIDHTKITNTVGYGHATTPTPITGVAYIFATTHSAHGSLEEAITLKASPTPHGICEANIWTAGLNLNPGQWTMVGEVTASTSNGTNWFHVDTVGYRANGVYDSCWVPMVEYWDTTTMGSPALPEEFGRCLPFFGSTDGGGTVPFTTREGDHNFFVEHNLGPVNSVRNIQYQVLVSSLKEDLDSNVDGKFASIHQMAASHGSAYGGTNVPYNSNHDLYNSTFSSGDGFLRDITDRCKIAMLDSRFARMTIIDDGLDGEALIGPDQLGAQYIRVIMERTR